MTFIAATIELRSFIADPINGYGLDYCRTDAVVPARTGGSQAQHRHLSSIPAEANLSSFTDCEDGPRAFVPGNRDLPGAGS